MEQERKAGTGERMPVYVMNFPEMKESNSLIKGQVFNRPEVINPELSEKMQKFILDKPQLESRTRQPERRSLSAPTDTELKISNGQSATSGTKRAKQTGSNGKNSYSSKISEDHLIDFKVPEGEQAEDYKIYIDCKNFNSSEVKVRMEGDFIVVHAKHQYDFDDHGMVWREFTRRWRIPEEVRRNKISCLLSRNNMLIIKAPRKPTSIIVPVEIEKVRKTEDH